MRHITRATAVLLLAFLLLAAGCSAATTTGGGGKVTATGKPTMYEFATDT